MKLQNRAKVFCLEKGVFLLLKVQLHRAGEQGLENINPITLDSCVKLPNGSNLRETLNEMVYTEDVLDESIIVEEDVLTRLTRIEQQSIKAEDISSEEPPIIVKHNGGVDRSSEPSIEVLLQEIELLKKKVEDYINMGIVPTISVKQ